MFETRHCSRLTVRKVKWFVFDLPSLLHLLTCDFDLSASLLQNKGCHLCLCVCVCACACVVCASKPVPLTHCFLVIELLHLLSHWTQLLLQLSRAQTIHIQLHCELDVLGRGGEGRGGEGRGGEGREGEEGRKEGERARGEREQREMEVNVEGVVRKAGDSKLRKSVGNTN